MKLSRVAAVALVVFAVGGCSPATTSRDAGSDQDEGLPPCTNGVRDGAETDVDCGGGTCPRCSDGRACLIPGDCQSLLCSAGACQAAASCANGTRDGAETDVDCGGALCAACASGQTCSRHFDCDMLLCGGGTCQTVAATCANGVMDARETDVDCGGPDCGACPDNSRCAVDLDCRSGHCGTTAMTCCGDTALLSWDVPDTNADGTCLTDLAGFRAYWGMASGSYTQTANIALTDPGLVCERSGVMGPCTPALRCSYRLMALPAGAWYFAVTAYDFAGNESTYSNEVSKTIYPCL